MKILDLEENRSERLKKYVGKISKSDSDLISKAVDDSRKQQLEILEFKGSNIWEGILEDMRSL